MSNGRVWLHCFISLLLMRCASSHVRPSPRTVTLNKHQLRGVERTVQLDGDNRTFAVDVYYEVHYGYLQDGVSRFLPAQKYIEDWPNVNYKSENRIMCPQNLPPLELPLAANARNLRQADSESDSDLYSAYLEQLYIRNAKLHHNR